jgi:hypothetical protein
MESTHTRARGTLSRANGPPVTSTLGVPIMNVCSLLQRLPVAIACVWLSAAQAQPEACTRFLGSWAGTWSQGFYGTQWIHITAVSPDCIAQVGYNPTGLDIPAVRHSLAIKDGVIEFVCHQARGGTCRFELVDGELRARYAEPSSFENLGVFRKQP